MTNELQVTVFCKFLVPALLAGCGTASDPPPPAPADMVLTGADVYTVDADRSRADAVAIRDGRIVAVGSNEVVEILVGDGTEVIDVGGRLVLPGFQDSHVHPIGAGLEALACNLNEASDLAGYRAIIAECNRRGDGWLLGGGWSMPVFGAGGAPDKAILDELAPERPAWLVSADGHTGWANSRALAIAGITASTPDPVDGVIDRDVNGEPSGSLQEGAMSLLDAHLPETTREQRLAALAWARDLLHGFGITSIQDAYVFEDDLDAYVELDRRDKLRLRVVASLWWERGAGLEQITELQRLRDRYTRGNIDAATVKIMQDGVLENYTAAMLEPYLEGGGTRGIPMIDPDLLYEAVPALDAAGFQVHFHAIGDAAIRQCLDAIEAAVLAHPDDGNSRRHHVSHLQVIHPDDVARFGELGAIANFQPLWAMADSYVLELNLPAIGPERVSWMYPIRSVMAHGGRVAFGSDWSVSTANPFAQIETAITRREAFGGNTPEFTPDERIDLESAIAAFTIDAAYVNRQDDETGSIEVGKYADLVIVDRDLFAIPADELSDAKALLTLFGGEIVFGDPQKL